MGNDSLLARLQEALSRFGATIPTLIDLGRMGDDPSLPSVWTASHGPVALAQMSDISHATVITKSCLFGNSEEVSKIAAERALRQVGRRLLEGLDPNDRSFQDIALRAGARHLAPHLGMPGATAEQIVEAVASVALADAGPILDRFRRELNPDFVRACDLLSRCPEIEVQIGAIEYYMAQDAEPAEKVTLMERRLRTGLAYPSLAGFFAATPAIASAIDSGDKLFQVVEEATNRSITRAAMQRLGQTSDLRARKAVAGGLLAGLPPDQYPNSPAAWKAALDLWEASYLLAQELSLPVRKVWNADRILQAKGNWEGLVADILRKGTDIRAPFAVGLAKPVADEILPLVDPQPFAAGDDVAAKLNSYLEKAESALRMIADRDGRPVAEAFDKSAFKGWMLRLCHHQVTPDTLAGSLRGLTEGATMLGMRVLLPNVLNAERLPGLPIGPSVLKGASASGFAVLADGLTFPQLAALSRNIAARAPLLSAPILTSRERAMGQGEDLQATKSRQNVDDQVWRRVFGIHEDTPDWPPLTAIREFKPGLVFVPVENMAQAKEEGTLTPGKLDRNGVPEMNHCMGLVHAPMALADGGAYQLFSIREVKNGTYRRIASGTFRLGLNKDGSVKIQEPNRGSTFVGPDNTMPPEAAVEIWEMFKEYVRTQPDVLNPEVFARLTQEQDRQVKRAARRDITLPRLLGYDPFPVYKLEAVWDKWRGSGLVAARYTNVSLGERAKLEELEPLQTAIREFLPNVGVVAPVKAPAAQSSETVDVPATKPRKTMGGTFF